MWAASAAGVSCSPGRAVSTVSGTGAVSAARAARSAWVVTWTPVARSASARPAGSAPTRATVSGSCPDGLRSGVHSTWKRESRWTAPAVPGVSLGTARETRESTDRTVPPAVSYTAMETVSSPTEVIRARTVVAPEAARCTPCQANGSPPWLMAPRSV
ncbi:hypothetical protein TNCT6_08020 [Streptomyces sp. 6-11-2]|nr:hypothetical protein TNCT6_08020 [Streptomyces sp. 6-11-2]